MTFSIKLMINLKDNVIHVSQLNPVTNLISLTVKQMFSRRRVSTGKSLPQNESVKHKGKAASCPCPSRTTERVTQSAPFKTGRPPRRPLRYPPRSSGRQRPTAAEADELFKKPVELCSLYLLHVHVVFCDGSDVKRRSQQVQQR